MDKFKVMPSNKRIFFYIVIAELVIILCLVYGLTHKHKIYVDPIWIKLYNFGNSSTFKYYYEPKPGQRIGPNTPFGASYTAHYSVNFDSLYSLTNYQVNKPEKTFRIVTLGNSFTAGLYVNTGRDWPSDLEHLLTESLKCTNINKFEVINLGVEGYDAAYEAERFKIRGEKYNPDLVLWFHTEFKKITELTMPIYFANLVKARHTRELAQQFKNKNYYVEWDSGKEQVANELGDVKIFKYQIGQITKMGVLYKGKIGFVLDPVSISNDAKSALKTLVAKRGNAFIIDSLRNFYKEDGVFPRDPHPNEKGDKMIAEDIYKYLVDNKIVSCSKSN